MLNIEIAYMIYIFPASYLLLFTLQILIFISFRALKNCIVCMHLQSIQSNNKYTLQYIILVNLATAQF